MAISYSGPRGGKTAPVPTKNIWTDGTDEEVVSMIQRAQAGQLNLQELWSVGDRRKVHLSAMTSAGVGETHVEQDVYFVLMNKGGVHFADDDKECSFIVGLENSLLEDSKMNSTATNTGSWNATPRRAWCNSVFYNAIPSTLRPIFKKMKIQTAKTYNGTEMEETEDYFALPAAREIFGGTTASTAGQGQTGYSNMTEWNTLTGPWEWYKSIHNRVKTLGVFPDYPSGDKGFYTWWERSPCYDGAAYFCHVNSNGIAAYSSAYYEYGLAPFGAI